MHEDLHRVVRLVEALARRERLLLLVRVSLRALRLALGLVFFALVAGPAFGGQMHLHVGHHRRLVRRQRPARQ